MPYDVNQDLLWCFIHVHIFSFISSCSFSFFADEIFCHSAYSPVFRSQTRPPSTQLFTVSFSLRTSGIEEWRQSWGALEILFWEHAVYCELLFLRLRSKLRSSKRTVSNVIFVVSLLFGKYGRFEARGISNVDLHVVIVDCFSLPSRTCKNQSRWPCRWVGWRWNDPCYMANDQRQGNKSNLYNSELNCPVQIVFETDLLTKDLLYLFSSF